MKRISVIMMIAATLLLLAGCTPARKSDPTEEVPLPVVQTEEHNEKSIDSKESIELETTVDSAVEETEETEETENVTESNPTIAPETSRPESEKPTESAPATDPERTEPEETVEIEIPEGIEIGEEDPWEVD